MSVAGVALLVGEASLRASLPLLAVLALRPWLSRWTSATTRRALLLAAVLMVPALTPLGALLPGLSLSLPAVAGQPESAISGAAPAYVPAMEVVLRGAAAVWLVGAIALLARLLAGLVRVHRHVREATPLRAPAWRADRDRMAAALELVRPPEIRVSPVECTPHAWGVVRPIVVVPRSARRWTAARRRAVLAHEIGHLVRREPVARIAAEFVRAIHWFDPLLRRAVVAFRRESEVAADEMALALGMDPREYAEQLVGLARERRVHPGGHAVAAFAAPGELQRRVEWVLSGPRSHPAPGVARLAVPAVAITTAVLMAIPRLAPPEASPLEMLSQRYSISVGLAGEILAAAEQEGIEPRVAFGLVSEESGFNATKISPSGAVGLTQMLPATAWHVERGLSPDELQTDSVNLRVGFRYLRTQIEREGGSVVRGLVAYAVGPGRLDDIRNSGQPIPLEYAARVLTRLD